LKADYSQLKQRIIDWMARQSDIRAVIQVGSGARTDHPADEWSDLDMMVFTSDPARYFADTGWLKEIDDVWISMQSQTVGGDEEQIVLFAGGNKVDFVIMDEQQLIGISKMDSLPEVYQRGSEILIDKDHRVTPIFPAVFRSPEYQKISPSDFFSLVNSAWFGSIFSAKLLRRGNLFQVKLFEARIQTGLTSVIELHTHATRGWEVDTWHGGHFIEEWADARILDGLKDLYSSYDLKDGWRALFARMDLIRWVLVEIADGLGLDYPRIMDERATRLITDLQKDAFLSDKALMRPL